MNTHRTLSSAFNIGQIATYLTVTLIFVGVVVATDNATAQNDRIFQGERINFDPITNLSYYSPSLFDRMERFLYNVEDNDGIETVSRVLYDGILVGIHSRFCADSFLQHYDDFEDLITSGGPQANQELCLRQLKQLIAKTSLLSEQKLKSKDIILNLLLDSFGRVPSGIFEGDFSWLGSYTECTGLKIKLDNNTQTETRYCLSSLRLSDWPTKGDLDKLVVMKQAVCLPKSCDSIDYKNKYQLVQQLADFNARQVDIGSYNLTALYCLPDEQSPLRMWWLKPGAVICVCLFSLWFAILVFATIKHQMILGSDTDRFVQPNRKLYESLSIVQNLKHLFDTSDKSSPLSKKQQTSISENGNGKEKPYHPLEDKSKGQGELSIIASNNDQQEQQQQLSEKPKPIVDLRTVGGIKVLAMIYIVFSHTLAVQSVFTKNETYFSVNGVLFKLLNGAPAFAVNAFFVITGLLTSYSLFKQNTIIASIHSPVKWFGLITSRYLRIMPVYLTVALYAKYLSKFASSGPLWDYGTSSLALRKVCEKESLLWNLLFMTDFKASVSSCVQASWYLANDFHFAILSPIFLTCLYKRPKFGIWLLIIISILSTASAAFSIYTSSVPDLRPSARFLTMGFKIIVTYLDVAYTRPHHRIAAYLVGILAGYVLFKFEQNNRKMMNLTTTTSQNDSVEQRENGNEERNDQVDDDKKKMTKSPNAKQQYELIFEHQLPSPVSMIFDWPYWFRPIGMSMSIFVVAICCLSSVIGPHFHYSKLGARILLSLMLPSAHVLFSLAVATYILLSSTGRGCKLFDRFLLMKFWKPLSRLSLCAVLINLEVIYYITQNRTQMQHFDTQFHISLNIYCTLLTYLFSILVHVLVEAPFKVIVRQLMAALFSKKE